MSTKHTLLALPLELRWNLYSHFYHENCIVEFPCPKPLYFKTGLSFSCPQLHQETLEYYYSRNTFSLPLWKKFVPSDWRFRPRHFNLVRVLHLEAYTFFHESSSDSAADSKHTEICRNRLKEYLGALCGVDEGVSAPILKTLILADSMPPSHSSLYWDRRTNVSSERLGLYVQVFKELNIGVGQVVVKLE